MTVDLKMEGYAVDSDSCLKNDLMGLSLLALLISPWALLGLGVSMLGYGTLPTGLNILCALILLTATPKLILLLLPYSRQLQLAKA